MSVFVQRSYSGAVAQHGRVVGEPNVRAVPGRQRREPIVLKADRDVLVERVSEEERHVREGGYQETDQHQSL